MSIPTDSIEQKLSNRQMNLARRVERHLTRRIGSGFLVLVPLTITLWILHLAFSFVDGVFRGENGLLKPFIRESPWDFWGLGVLIALTVFYITGAFLAGKKVRAWEDSLISRIPVLGGIYSVSRQSIDALSANAGRRFSRVVFIEWPRPGVKALGFVTGQIPSQEKDGPSTILVYIPTVPNPTSGMLAWLSEEEVFGTDLSVEDAMKAVFSGGIVLPEMPSGQGLSVLLPEVTKREST